MIIRHTALFEKSLNNILSCGHNYYTEKVLRRLFAQYKKSKDALLANPYIGQIEPLLDSSALEYRRIVIKPYFKLIYTVGDGKIILVDLWDTRQSPTALSSRID